MRIEHHGSPEGAMLRLPGVSPGLPPETAVSTHIIDHLAEHVDPGDRFDTVAIGTTGLHGPRGDLTEALARWRTRFGVRRLLVTSDDTAAHLGALLGRPGVVLSAGTGSVALAVGPRGVRRVDGVGYLLGDDGSGFWIGRAGLAAALRSRDGRGPATELTPLAVRRYGDPASLPRILQNSATPSADIAAFCPDVAAAAGQGDAVAGEIWAEAGALLARTIAAGAHEVEAPEHVAVSWVGSLFDAGAVLVEPLTDELRRYLPQAWLVAPAGTAIDGASRLLRDVPAAFTTLVSDITEEDG